LPKPHSSSNRFTYYGYIVAGSAQEAEAIFKDKTKSRVTYLNKEAVDEDMNLIANDF